jgi:hypothetical protein
MRLGFVKGGDSLLFLDCVSQWEKLNMQPSEWAENNALSSLSVSWVPKEGNNENKPEMLDANVDRMISCFVRVVCDIPHTMLGVSLCRLKPQGGSIAKVRGLERGGSLVILFQFFGANFNFHKDFLVLHPVPWVLPLHHHHHNVTFLHPRRLAHALHYV